MDTSGIIFWNVDTQRDFVEPSGNLYVSGAELLKPVWAAITSLASAHSVRVVSSADYHFPDAEELSDRPDFVRTFPPHCMAGTPGSAFIDETNPESPVVIGWDRKLTPRELQACVEERRNVVLRKNVFDVFAGNPNTDLLLEWLKPEVVVVYGVTTNVCVDFAVRGLAGKVRRVIVISDAVRELPQIPLPFSNWHSKGVEMIPFSAIQNIFEQVA